MVTDYDQGDVAEQYAKTKTMPVRSRIEQYSFLKHVGDVTGKKVLDVACGAGHYTRMLRQAGADPVVGFDISEKMIAAARAQEARRPLGIDYVVADLRVPVPRQDFDLAVAAYVLVYARDRGELAKMCRGLAARLRPGGRFVTLTTNPELYHYGSLPDYSKYGFRIGLSDNVAEGAPIELSVALEGGALVIENYYLPIEAYESALSDAGFGEIRVHRPELSPAPEGADEGVEEGDFWADYLNKPPTVVIECVRL